MPINNVLVCKYVPNRECPKGRPCMETECLACLIYKSSQDLKDDKVAHPSHYVEGRKYEPKDVIRDWGLNYNLGCVVKYVSRAGRKDDILQDLRKARQYLEFEIDAIEEENKRCQKWKRLILRSILLICQPAFLIYI